MKDFKLEGEMVSFALKRKKKKALITNVSLWIVESREDFQGQWGDQCSNKWKK